MKRRGDVLAESGYLLEVVNNWRIFLEGGLEERDTRSIRSHEHTGRPLGDVVFIERLERVLNRTLRKNRPGP
jgi:putative transposase